MTNYEKYAELVIKKGINVQENQPVVIVSPVECYQFVQLLVKEGYKAGASQVIVEYHDQINTRLNLENQSDETLSTIEQYIVDKYDILDQKDASYISISANDPDNLIGVDVAKISLTAQARFKYLNEHTQRVMANQQKWCVISVPTLNWSKKVFPNSTDPINMMWEHILKMTRCDLDDPIVQWDKHTAMLQKRYQFLNENRFDSLLFESSNGTNLKVGLVKNHVWCGGSEHSAKGIEFIANIPTEEVFTMPDSNIVDGVVFSSKPLNYQGQLIDKFSLTFKDGQVIDFTAEVGYDALEALLNVDAGARRTGEVAIVDNNSPISKSGVLFYNTLFDENAACHIALGNPYPINKSDYDLCSDKSAAGINSSAIHVDFMFGTSDMKITGITSLNETIVFFNEGNFCI